MAAEFAVVAGAIPECPDVWEVVEEAASLKLIEAGKGSSEPDLTSQAASFALPVGQKCP